MVGFSTGPCTSISDFAATCVVSTGRSSVYAVTSPPMKTKYYYVIIAFNKETAQRLLSLLENHPANDKYQALTQSLLVTFDQLQQKCAIRLISMPEMSNRKPSALMDYMLTLLPNHASCFLFTFNTFFETLKQSWRMKISMILTP